MESVWEFPRELASQSPKTEGHRAPRALLPAPGAQRQAQDQPAEQGKCFQDLDKGSCDKNEQEPSDQGAVLVTLTVMVTSDQRLARL